MFEHSAAEEVQEKPLAVKSNGYRNRLPPPS